MHMQNLTSTPRSRYDDEFRASSREVFGQGGGGGGVGGEGKHERSQSRFTLFGRKKKGA